MGFFLNIRGWYGLPQSGKLANGLLRTHLNKSGYYEAATTPGLWKHTWRPIQFCLIVDDFGIEYVGGGMPTTSAKYSKNIMNSRNIGKEKNIQALT